MEPPQFIWHLKEDGRALLAAGKQAPSARVPSCPEWDARTLVGHLGGAYWWVEKMVRERATEMGAFADEPEDFDALCAWYHEGLAALVTTLEQVGPDEPVWNWTVMGPGPARFWHRRVAHEASVHRWDIEQAVGVARGRARAIDADMAADGIEEYLGIVSVWMALSSQPGLSGTLGLVATDAELSYTLRLAPDSIEHEEGLHGADAVVRAGVSDLFLWLLGRRDTASDAIIVEGDRSIAQRWSAVTFG